MLLFTSKCIWSCKNVSCASLLQTESCHFTVTSLLLTESVLCCNRSFAGQDKTDLDEMGNDWAIRNHKMLSISTASKTRAVHHIVDQRIIHLSIAEIMCQCHHIFPFFPKITVTKKLLIKFEITCHIMKMQEKIFIMCKHTLSLFIIMFQTRMCHKCQHEN